ncbi:MAG: hypothetical protein P4M13_07600 [Alphaproteobacteria bacterium]|nr:hypothetical protein [Alphaproteobacteria bacterium]
MPIVPKHPEDLIFEFRASSRFVDRIKKERELLAWYNILLAEVERRQQREALDGIPILAF